MVMQMPQIDINAHLRMLVFVAWAAYGVIPTIHWTIHLGGLENPVVAVSSPIVISCQIYFDNLKPKIIAS